MRGMTNYSDMQDGDLAQLGRSRPLSLSQLFWAFTWLSLQGFGGVLAVVQRELVEKRRWLSREEFVEQWAVAQVLPGANVVNISLMLGDRYFGWRGGLTALAGLLAFPLLIVLALAVVFAGVSDEPQVQGALRGMSAVTAGLIAATGLKLLPALKTNRLPTLLKSAMIAITFVAIAVLRVRLIWVLLVVGGLGALWAYRLLDHPETAPTEPHSNAGTKPPSNENTP
jgi:chromate transporter